MATSYSAIPSGGLYDIPASLPQGLLYRYKKISNVSRQTMKFPPNNGQGDVWAGQVINVTLPPNALIDLSTLLWTLMDILNIMEQMVLLDQLAIVNHDFFLEIHSH